MKKIFFVLFVTFLLLGSCQSFVFCPEIKTEERISLKDVELSIVFKDSRVYEKKVKEECTKTEIFAEFINCFRQTFPNIKITVLDENKLDENPTKGNITLKINFQKYDVTFYTGMYIANTKYEVIILDNRNGQNIIKETITGKGKQFNALGYKSAKIALNSSFKEAFDGFTILLDKLTDVHSVSNNNNQTQTPQYVNTKSKADRLRELKQLLDEKILTQEEYDKEKKKILDEK